MRVLVALPVFNEERYVEDMLARVRRWTDDILVVNDGSTDATQTLLDATPSIEVIRHERTRGYGQSLIDAFDYAARRGYDWIVTIDCDDQHEPDRIPMFIERAARDDFDIVSGSRYLMELPGNTPAPTDRRRINARISRLLNERLRLHLSDAFCGFKAYRVSALSRLSLSISGYAFPLQFWVQAAHHGLRICELPVQLIYNDPTRHFGGMLDDPDARLKHYLTVFEAELARSRAAVEPEHPICEFMSCAS